MPSTRTRRQALFAVEELKLGAGRARRRRAPGAGDGRVGGRRRRRRAAALRRAPPARTSTCAASRSSHLAELAPGWKLAADLELRRAGAELLRAVRQRRARRRPAPSRPATRRWPRSAATTSTSACSGGAATNSARVGAYAQPLLELHLARGHRRDARERDGETLPVYAFRGVPRALRRLRGRGPPAARRRRLLGLAGDRQGRPRARHQPRHRPAAAAHRAAARAARRRVGGRAVAGAGRGRRRGAAGPPRPRRHADARLHARQPRR